MCGHFVVLGKGFGPEVQPGKYREGRGKGGGVRSHVLCCRRAFRIACDDLGGRAIIPRDDVGHMVGPGGYAGMTGRTACACGPGCGFFSAGATRRRLICISEASGKDEAKYQQTADKNQDFFHDNRSIPPSNADA